MSFNYHGNYCGPGWSAGQWQSSVVSDIPATDQFDESCKAHDGTYAKGGDLMDADFLFAKQNLLTTNPKRWVAGALVGLQGVGRYISRSVDKDPFYQENSKNFPFSLSTSITNMPKRNRIAAGIAARVSQFDLEHPTPRVRDSDLRQIRSELTQALQAIKSGGAKAVNRAKGRNRRAQPSVAPIRISQAPVSIGSTITASKPTVVGTPEGVLARGREFLVPVTQANQANWQIGALAPLHPCYYPASTMGTISRAYQFYRYRRVVVHFVTKEPTSTNGEILLAFAPNLLEPAENGAGANFLSRAMTRGRAILGPIWSNHSLEIDCKDTWMKVDAFNSSVFNDNVLGEVQAYTLAGSADTSGYLLIDYELEFKETMFTPHSANLPITTGPGSTYVGTQGVGTATNAVLLTSTTMFGTTPVGTVWRFVVDADQSSIVTGTMANAWYSGLEYATTTAAVIATVTTNLPIVDGLAVYMVNIGGQTGAVYVSYEAAVSGDSSGQIFVRTAYTALSLTGNAYVVRLDPLALTAAD
jgi:hypothetical protein